MQLKSIQTEAVVSFETGTVQYDTTIKIRSADRKLLQNIESLNIDDLQEILKIWFESPEWTKIK